MSVRLKIASAVVAVASVAAGLIVFRTWYATEPCPLERPSDFNGDGHRDIAVGSRHAGDGGSVTVLYGGTSRRQTVSQATTGIPGAPERSDEFGASLTSADFDGDGYADLAVGALTENYNDPPGHEGRITLVYGGPAGLSSRAVRLAGEGRPLSLTAGDFDCDGAPDLAAGLEGDLRVYDDLASGDRTGTLTKIGRAGNDTGTVITEAADFTGDGYPDLAVSIAWPAVDGHERGEGGFFRLNVYKGSSSGLGDEPSYSDHESAGAAMAAGDVNGDGKADLVGWGPDGIRVHPGTGDGVRPPAEVTAEFKRTSEPSITLGDVNGDGRSDAAIGTRPSYPDRSPDTVTVLYGTDRGLTTRGVQRFTPGVLDLPPDDEDDGAFATDVSMADLDGDQRAELAIGGTRDGNDTSLFILSGTAQGLRTTSVKTVEVLRKSKPREAVLLP